jgi:hypothetical protein
MNQLFLEKGYLHVPNFITISEAEILTKQFKQHTSLQNIHGDNQVPASKAVYNFLPFVLLLVNKVPDINKLYGHYVLPTYTYARVYQKGADLKEHIDRPACEISITLNLSKTRDWPIFFKTSNNETVSLELNPGDAVMYLGCQRPHWRNVYEGDEHVQVFLHYVAAYGDNNWAFFDKTNAKPSISNYLQNHAVGRIPLVKYE